MKNCIFTICAALFLTANCARAQKNLVMNGGFEDDLYGWNNGGAAKQTRWDFKAGKNSCAIIAMNTDKWQGIDQTISVPKKAQAIEVSAWIKTVNVIKGKNDWDGAVFTIVFLDWQNKEMGEGVNIARITGDQQWTLSKKIIKIPEKTFNIKILVALGNASGTMLIDDVTAIAAKPDEVPN